MARLLGHGFVLITPDGVGLPLSNGCPVCQTVIRTSDDVQALESFRCCHPCLLRWAQGRQGPWAEGWRPSALEVSEELAARRLTPHPVPLF